MSTIRCGATLHDALCASTYRFARPFFLADPLWGAAVFFAVFDADPADRGAADRVPVVRGVAGVAPSVFIAVESAAAALAAVEPLGVEPFRREPFGVEPLGAEPLGADPFGVD